MIKEAIYESIFDDNCILRVPCKVDTDKKIMTEILDVNYETEAVCIKENIIIDSVLYPFSDDAELKSVYSYGDTMPVRTTLDPPVDKNIVIAQFGTVWDGNVLCTPCYVNLKTKEISEIVSVDYETDCDSPDSEILKFANNEWAIDNDSDDDYYYD